MILPFLISISFGLYGQARRVLFTEYQLKNGLHVILCRNSRAPVVAINVLYHVGSKDEKPGRTGFAHFFEHLLFEGSANMGRGDFARHAEEAGGYWNAYTNYDVTTYHDQFPAKQLEMGLWLESERMLHAKIDSVGVNTQWSVVKEEKYETEDNVPYGQVWQEISRRAFAGHPYEHPIIGSVEDLDQATLDEFMDFYNAFYVPKNATLCIAGDIDFAEARRLVDKYFSDIHREPVGAGIDRRLAAPPPPLRQEVRDTIYDEKIQIPLLSWDYRIPPIVHRDRYALDMLARILAQGPNSRLKAFFDSKEKKTAFQINGYCEQLEEAGLFSLSVSAYPDSDLAVIEQDVDREINRLRNELISSQEMQGLRNFMEASAAEREASMASLAEDLNEFYAVQGDTRLINRQLGIYARVKPKDIRRVAEKYLRPENRVMLYCLPAAR